MPLAVLVHIIHTEGIMSSSGVEALPKYSTVVLIKLDNNQGFFQGLSSSHHHPVLFHSTMIIKRAMMTHLEHGIKAKGQTEVILLAR